VAICRCHGEAQRQGRRRSVMGCQPRGAGSPGLSSASVRGARNEDLQDDDEDGADEVHPQHGAPIQSVHQPRRRPRRNGVLLRRKIVRVYALDLYVLRRGHTNVVIDH
jgi:hypothetical protein